MRDQREYHRKLRADPAYRELQRLNRKARMEDPVYAERRRTQWRERSRRRRLAQRELLNEQARTRHSQRMANDVEYRKRKAEISLLWIKKNPEKALSNVVRRDAQKLRAIPAWADKARIDGIYRLAVVQRDLGIECEVDHVVPLRSPYVCGLHVPENLQLLSPSANKSKGNRHWPDHPNG